MNYQKRMEQKSLQTQNCRLYNVKSMLLTLYKAHRGQASSDCSQYKKKDSRIGKTKIRVLYALLGICILVAIISTVGLGYELYTNNQGQSYYTGLNTNIQRHTRNPDSLAVINQPAIVPGAVEDKEDNNSRGYDGNNNNVSEPAVKTYSIETPTWAPYVDFKLLNESLPGISAWIKLENTVLDYPIMQGTDNNYFLGHLPDGTKHRSGSIFFDYRNNADLSDKNTLIYGHESRTGDMFGILKSYRKQSFYEANPIIYIYTQEKDYKLLLFAGYLVDSGVESPPLDFRDDAAFISHIEAIKQRSLFRSDVEVSADDRIISLCTCAYDYPNARLVIVGKIYLEKSEGA